MRVAALAEFRVPPVVQVVSIDAMNTLICPREPVPAVYARTAKEHGVSVDENRVAAAFPTLFKQVSKASPCFGHRGDGPFSWWSQLIVGALRSAGSGPLSDQKIEQISRQLYDHYTHADAWRIVDDEVTATLTQLRRKGIALCVVSNFDGRLKGILAGLGMDKFFSMQVLSGEIGFEKPDGRIFDVVLRNFSLSDPSVLLHIGDHPQKDLRAARAFGARGLLFDPQGMHSDIPSHDRISSFSQLKLY